MPKKISSGEKFENNTSGHESEGKRMRKTGSSGVEYHPGRSNGASSLFSCHEFVEEGNDVVGECMLSPKYHQEDLQMMAGVGILDDLYLDFVSPPFQACGEIVPSSITYQESQPINVEPSQDQRSHAFPFSSFGILKNRQIKENGTTNGRKLHGPITEKTMHPYNTSSPSPSRTNFLIELAAGKFIHSNSSSSHLELSQIIHQHEYRHPCLCTEDGERVQLLLDLLSCAEHVGNHEYDGANRLLEECHRRLSTSSHKTDAIHRLVYHFTQALSEKINRETGRFKENDGVVKNLCQYSETPCPSVIAFYSKSPLIHITGFTGVQVIVDQVKECRKVHVIDLGVRCGAQQVILMEALAARTESPIEHLKITAVTTKMTKTTAKETGVRLKSLAESLNLNFSFSVIFLEDVIDLLINIDPRETTVVHATFVLNHLIAMQHQLETLMRVIRRINPRVMVISESEANINSPVFVNRFVEALFFFGANFDWIEYGLKDDPTIREFAESRLYGPGIINILAAEGEERKYRIVGMNVWRAFFSRFGMVETELSESSLQHAALIRARFECGDSCTLDMDRKSLIVGWKGSAIYSLSAWRFQGIRSRRRF